MKENDIVQSARLYIFMGGKLRHITTSEVLQKMKEDLSISSDWNNRKFIDDDDIDAHLGKPISDWPEEPEPEIEIRKWAIAGTCMDRTGWYDAFKEIGFTHVYFNRACWMDLDRLADMGIKAFINITGEKEEHWKTVVADWIDHAACGGYWLDDEGHEPDISRRGEPFDNWQHRLEVRKRFYQVVRDMDSDKWNHPVMEIMDNTGTGDFPDRHPGWGLAYSSETHDLLLADIYPDYASPADKPKMIADMTKSWEKFISRYPEHQVIIQMIANGNKYWPGYIRTQYEFWSKRLGPEMGVCWYKQELWMKSEEMRNEMKEVVREATHGV